VSQENGGWHAVCEEREATRAQLVDAIREAVGQEAGAGLLRGAASTISLERWIRETAARIVGDTLH
jgi:hypothetical protein